MFLNEDPLITDDEHFEDGVSTATIPEMRGTLSKWTNYLHGWQDRYFILKQGTLSYYKSEDDVECGCRGAVSLVKAIISPHELDELRFDVILNDNAWYLRSDTVRCRTRWLDALDFYKSTMQSPSSLFSSNNNINMGGITMESGFSNDNNTFMLKRQPSALSVTSGTSLSAQSISSFKLGLGLREKLSDMETFRDILSHQVDVLLRYFDFCSTLSTTDSSISHPIVLTGHNMYQDRENISLSSSLSNATSNSSGFHTEDTTISNNNGNTNLYTPNSQTNQYHDHSLSHRYTPESKNNHMTQDINPITTTFNVLNTPPTTVNNENLGLPVTSKSQTLPPLTSSFLYHMHRRTPSLPVPNIFSKMDLFGAASSLLRDKLIRNFTNALHTSNAQSNITNESNINNSNLSSLTNPYNGNLESQVSNDISSTNSLTGHKDSEMEWSTENINKNFTGLNSTLSQNQARSSIPWNKWDLKGEAFTFKATAAGLVATLSHSIELMYQREERWRRKLEKEIEKRKKVEELYRQAQTFNVKQALRIGGPDFEEGPHSSIKEDEFFDAVETTLDKLDKEEYVLSQRQKFALQQSINAPSIKNLESSVESNLSSLPNIKTHRLSYEIEQVFKDQLVISQVDVEHNDINLTGTNNDTISNKINNGNISAWQLIAQEGDMKIFKRELEEEGLVCDPLKAIHYVQGVTAREMCHYFFDPKYRYDWETTLESMKVLEILSEDTLIFHQLHKRVWPATQRDSCFWSHIRKISTHQSLTGLSCNNPISDNELESSTTDRWCILNNWAVCNYSNDHGQATENNCIRVKLAVFLHCQTLVRDHVIKAISNNPSTIDKNGDNVTDFETLITQYGHLKRNDIKCKITYCSKINPGGWTPPSVLRAVYKREYPKFLKKFTNYVKDMTREKDILI